MSTPLLKIDGSCPKCGAEKETFLKAFGGVEHCKTPDCNYVRKS